MTDDMLRLDKVDYGVFKRKLKEADFGASMLWEAQTYGASPYVVESLQKHNQKKMLFC